MYIYIYIYISTFLHHHSSATLTHDLAPQPRNEKNPSPWPHVVQASRTSSVRNVAILRAGQMRVRNNVTLCNFAKRMLRNP